MNQGPSLNEYVHPSLVDAAQQTSKAMSDFGVASEELLMRHGKKIVDKQFHLWRLADAAIDIYGMVATLSRSVIVKEVKRGNLPFTPFWGHPWKRVILHLDFFISGLGKQFHFACIAFSAWTYRLTTGKNEKVHSQHATAIKFPG